MAGYFSWGQDGGLGQAYATNGTVTFNNASGWYLVATAESYNGRRSSFQGSFLNWFSSGAFGGTSYSNTPVGATISHVDEPSEFADNTYNYFGLWAAGKSFAICAWAGQVGTYISISSYLSERAIRLVVSRRSADPFVDSITPMKTKTCNYRPTF